MATMNILSRSIKIGHRNIDSNDYHDRLQRFLIEIADYPVVLNIVK